MSKTIYEPKPRYLVESGEGSYVQKEPDWVAPPELTAIHWSFDKAFNQEKDAISYADRMAEDHEFVRVIDREE